MHEQVRDHLKHAVDGAALLTTVAAITKILPALAAVLSIIWTAIRIYETRTVQALVARFRKQGD